LRSSYTSPHLSQSLNFTNGFSFIWNGYFYHILDLPMSSIYIYTSTYVIPIIYLCQKSQIAINNHFKCTICVLCYIITIIAIDHRRYWLLTAKNELANKSCQGSTANCSSGSTGRMSFSGRSFFSNMSFGKRKPFLNIRLVFIL